MHGLVMANEHIPDLTTTLSGRDPRTGDWGLYRCAYERDSCGFGLIASLDDQASHWVLQTAISSLNRLTHRGAIAADGKTGDGCGLLIKTPTRFLRAAAAEAQIILKRAIRRGTRVLGSRLRQGGRIPPGARRADRTRENERRWISGHECRPLGLRRWRR